MKHRIDAEVEPVQRPRSSGVARVPWSWVACDVLVVLLGLWTLVCHAVVFLGGGFEELLASAAVAGALLLLALGGLALYRRRASGPGVRGDAAPEGGGAPGVRAPLPSAGPGAPGARLGPADRGLLVLALAVAVLPLLTDGARVTWWGLVLLLGAVAWRSRDAVTQPPAPAPAGSRAAELALWSLALAAGFFAVSVHVSSPDDGYYINVAVAALDHPAAPLLARDTLHGVDAPLMYSVYRVHSHELLIAAVSRLIGRTPLRTAHAYLPLLFGVLVVLAHGRLLRELVPRRWLLATLVLVLLLAVVNETPQYHGRFAFARLQQGKAVFLSALAPLVVVYALRFAREPTARRWGLLGLAQVASVGMTSTALWCVPVISGLALVAGAPWSVRGARRVAAGVASSAYVLALGLAFRADSVRQTAAEAGEGVQLVRITARVIDDGGELVRAAWRVVFGAGVFGWLCFLAVLVAWACVREGRARRWLVAVPLGAALAFLNPYTGLEVARAVTGAITYWRSLWLVPVPVFLAIVVTRPWERGGLAWRGATVVLAALLLGLAPARFFTQPKNGVIYQPFGLKIMGEPFRTALAVRQLSAPGDPVLVAKGASQWVPAFRNHPYPLVTRPNYLGLLAPYLEPGEAESRRRLFDYVSGDSEDSEAPLLRRALRRYRPSVVTFRLAGPFADEIRAVLRAAGYRAAVTLNVSEVWALPRGG